MENLSMEKYITEVAALSERMKDFPAMSEKLDSIYSVVNELKKIPHIIEKHEVRLEQLEKKQHELRGMGKLLGVVASLPIISWIVEHWVLK